MRVAPTDSFRANGTLPMRFAEPPVSCDAVYNATSEFCASSSARIVFVGHDDGLFVHAIFSTLFFGFVDDFYVGEFVFF